MSVLRSFNYLSQMRWDLPFAKSIESSICADFDALAGNALSGRYPLVLKGLTVSTSGTLSGAVENLQLNVAGTVLMHYGASESGTIFLVDDNAPPEILAATNGKVIGAFTASSVNYVGLDLIKTPDASTSDSVQFLDADTDLEISQIVPLGRVLQYRIIISTQNFSVSTNVLPIAKIVTSSTNTVVSITDARNMMFRLGSGGDNPNPLYVFPWSSRTENPNTYTGGADPFISPDKNINNLKDSLNSIFSSIWDVKGGEHWYSAVNRDNVKVIYATPSILSDNVVFNTGAQTLTWEAISLAFENADNPTVYFNTIANNTTFGVNFNTDGMCLYVDLQRESNATNIPAVVGNLQTLGTSTIPGRRIIIAWRVAGVVYIRDRQYNTAQVAPVASTSVLGLVKTNNTPADSANPTAIVLTTGGGASVTATSGNTAGFVGTGKGTQDGLRGVGGDSSGTGVFGLGGAPNGMGVQGTGTGTGIGVKGNSTGAGAAVSGQSSGTGAAGSFTNSGAGNSITASGPSDFTGLITAHTGFTLANGTFTVTNGDVVTSNGNFVADTGHNFTYASALNKSYIIAGADFQQVTGGVTANLFNNDTSYYSWHTSGSGDVEIIGRADIPAGAAVSSLNILVTNNSGISQNVPVVMSYIDSAGAWNTMFTGNISCAAGTSYTASGAVTPHTLDATGVEHVALSVTLPTGVSLQFRQAKVGYTLTALRPG